VDNPSPGGAGPGGTFPPLPETDAVPVDSLLLPTVPFALPLSKAQGMRVREPAPRRGLGVPPPVFQEEGVWGAERPLPRGPGGQGERGRLRAPSPLLSVDLARERLDCGAPPHHTTGIAGVVCYTGGEETPLRS
jgi:hypothetical protein